MEGDPRFRQCGQGGQDLAGYRGQDFAGCRSSRLFKEAVEGGDGGEEGRRSRDDIEEWAIVTAVRLTAGRHTAIDGAGANRFDIVRYIVLFIPRCRYRAGDVSTNQN